MKKIVISFLAFIIAAIPCYSLGRKNNKAVLYMAENQNLLIDSMSNKAQFDWVFKINSKIYFQINSPKGFKSDYIKLQIVKQDDNAHVGGYTRIKNKTVRVQSKYSYGDYFIISQKGKYFIQIFDIENLQQWLAIGSFLVVE